MTDKGEKASGRESGAKAAKGTSPSPDDDWSKLSQRQTFIRTARKVGADETGEEAAMSYWVYAAYPQHWVTVHRGECSHCNEGKGQLGRWQTQGYKRPPKLKKTAWFGPYETLEQVAVRTDALERDGMKITCCGHCCP